MNDTLKCWVPNKSNQTGTRTDTMFIVNEVADIVAEIKVQMRNGSYTKESKRLIAEQGIDPNKIPYVFGATIEELKFKINIGRMLNNEPLIMPADVFEQEMDKAKIRLEEFLNNPNK